MGKFYHDFLNIRPYDYKNKSCAITVYIATMLNRTEQIFEYTGLPKTIPARMLENYLQRYGAVCITKVKNDLYAFFGGLGGEPDVYYQPTLYTIANPALNYSASLKIGTECEIVRNDSMMQGLFPIFSRYATALCENDISLDMANKHLRAQFAITAPDDTSLAAANKFLKDLADGEESAIGTNAFLDGIGINPMMQSGLHILQELTEYQQYIKASWFNEIGLNANFNMKRENLNESETEMNFDALLPLIENMLKERKEGIERVNKMYGTNITVELSGVWAKTQTEMENPETEPDESGDSKQLENSESEPETERGESNDNDEKN